VYKNVLTEKQPFVNYCGMKTKTIKVEIFLNEFTNKYQIEPGFNFICVSWVMEYFGYKTLPKKAIFYIQENPKSPFSVDASLDWFYNDVRQGDIHLKLAQLLDKAGLIGKRIDLWMEEVK